MYTQDEINQLTEYVKRVSFKYSFKDIQVHVALMMCGSFFLGYFLSKTDIPTAIVFLTVIFIQISYIFKLVKGLKRDKKFLNFCININKDVINRARNKEHDDT